MSYLPEPKNDGLLIPEVGDWARDKHYYLMRYIDAFTQSMKNQDWHGLHYIDLFANAGIVRLRDSKKLEWGSPLIAAHVPNPFTGIHVCEKDFDLYDALSNRLQDKRPDSQIIHGDANEKVHEIIHEIPTNSLSLAFLDPNGLHLYYDTIKILSERRTDLIIYFPDRIDILRNWAEYYLENPESNLDRYLGKGPDWRSILLNSPPERYAERVLDLYIDQLRKIGYKYFDQRRIFMTKGKPLYLLLFCSKHNLGVQLWRGISEISANRQREFNFGDEFQV